MQVYGGDGISQLFCAGASASPLAPGSMLWDRLSTSQALQNETHHCISPFTALLLSGATLGSRRRSQVNPVMKTLSAEKHFKLRS